MITKQTATAEEVREAFVAPDAEAAVKEITGIIDRQLDMEKTWELFEACMEASKGVVEENAKPWEKMLWIARQAYLFGFNYAATLHYEAAEQGYKALFCGGVRSNPYPLSAEIRRCGGLRGGCSNE